MESTFLNTELRTLNSELRALKRAGFSDARIAELAGVKAADIAALSRLVGPATDA